MEIVMVEVKQLVTVKKKQLEKRAKPIWTHFSEYFYCIESWARTKQINLQLILLSKNWSSFHCKLGGKNEAWNFDELCVRKQREFKKMRKSWNNLTNRILMWVSSSQDIKCQTEIENQKFPWRLWQNSWGNQTIWNGDRNLKNQISRDVVTASFFLDFWNCQGSFPRNKVDKTPVVRKKVGSIFEIKHYWWQIWKNLLN